MRCTEMLFYQTRTGRIRCRVRNEHGTAYTGEYRNPRGVLIEIEQILEGVSISEGQPCLNPEAPNLEPLEIEG
jgi:hypothetical protein